MSRQLEAIYHTAIVVHDRELYYGGGINVSRPGATPFGQPMQVLLLGHTELDEEMLELLLAELAERWTPTAYRLLSNNCNTFSNELAQLLVGKGIPDHIVSLPDEVLSTPFGQMVKPFLTGLEQQMASMRSQAYQPSALVPTPAAAPAPATCRSRLAAEAEAAGAPALAAAEVEIEAAIAEGMIEEAEAATGAQQGKAQQGKPMATGDERLTAELEVKSAFERLSARDGVCEHDALVEALEAVSPRASNGAAAAAEKEAEQH